MNNLQDNSVEQRKVEKVVMVVYTMYIVAMMIRAVNYGWESWIGVFLIIGLGVCLAVCISKYRNYDFRAKMVAIMLESSLFLYTYAMGDLYVGLPVQIAFIAFFGLYGILDVVYITVFFSFALFFFHGVIIDTLPWGTTQEILSIVAQAANVAMVEAVVWIWIKTRIANDVRINEVIKELSMAERSKDEFLANVSHEIRTPINTICGISEILLRNELPAGVKDNVLNVQSAGQNLMSVVSDILDFSELQSGKMELEEEAYHIATTVSDIITMSLARKMDKRIELIIDCDANIPATLLGDEKKLRRVIMNLVDNAIKFTDKGCVTIGIGFRKEEYGINLMVTVRDTGIGMDEENLDKMFTRFHQVDASAGRSEGGLGLGLAISHALIRKMGGIITIKSRPGRGTEVRFVVPQKVLDATPVASLRNPADVKVATFIDFEQFGMMAIRDEYSEMVKHMVEGLKARCHVCRNFPQLQRRQEKEAFTHIFTSIVEYRENKKYFDEISDSTCVIVILNRADEKYISNTKIQKVYKPFSLLSVVAAVNGSNKEEQEHGSAERFVTRDTRVLVVDDNRMNIRVIAGLLEHYNMAVTVANSGREALDKIETADYDFVFMDHMMPEMDGVETMHRIRHKVGNYYRKVPIVALTANAVAGTREALIAEGFNDFLEKPIERSVLERVLKRTLPPEKIVYVEDVAPAEISQEQTLLGKLIEAGVDVQKGMVYCGGEDAYFSILQGYCGDYEESGYSLTQLFEKQDWKNYTIAVHGIKSAMGSIGAVGLSEQAKKLEAAGKAGDIAYILEKHEDLAESYRNFFENLNKMGLSSNESAADAKSALPVLEDDTFDEIIAEMETAMYSLDRDTLEAGLNRLEEYQYNGKSLSDVVRKARRKVEMSDFMSAVDMVAKQKKHP